MTSRWRRVHWGESRMKRTGEKKNFFASAFVTSTVLGLVWEHYQESSAKYCTFPFSFISHLVPIPRTFFRKRERLRKIELPRSYIREMQIFGTLRVGWMKARNTQRILDWKWGWGACVSVQSKAPPPSIHRMSRQRRQSAAASAQRTNKVWSFKNNLS